MSHYLRTLLLIGLIAALPRPAAAQAKYYDGLIQYSTITNCASIIQGVPYQEKGAGTFVGFYANPNASQPQPNSVYYIHVVVAGLGNSCSGMRAYVDIALPPNTTTAIDATYKVYCYANGVATAANECPQSLPASTINPGAFQILSIDSAHAYLWPLPQGGMWEFQIPVKSTTTLSNATFQANVWVLDGNSSPTLRPTQGAYVFSAGGGSVPAISMPTPSTTLIQATTAHSVAYLTTPGPGTGHFQLGTTTSYGVINEASPIPSGGSWMAWDDWGPPALTPGTLYHWRYTFTLTATGTTYNGPDQTFQTLGNGQVSIGDGTPASCTSAAINTALVTSGTSNIVFNCGISPITITLSGPHTISTAISINGGNAVTLRRQNDGLGNLFNVASGGHLTLSQLTLQDSINLACGGAISVAAGGTLTLSDTRFVNNTSNSRGGAVCNDGTTTISTSLFSANSTTSTHGGAISNYGTLTIANSKFAGNSAPINGGAIDSIGTVTATGTTFDTNTAGFRGGGINTYVGTLTLAASTFVKNSAGLYGGGVASDGSVTAISSTTFSDNSSANLGGGIEMSGAGSLTLTNSTLSGNRATTNGGGLYWTAGAGTGLATILNTTIASNSAGTEGGNIHVGSVGTYNASIGLKNTIVAFGSPDNCSGTVLSNGNNLENVNTCGLTVASDKPSVVPKLAQLQDAGGGILVRRLLVGSPAINGGADTGCPATDERGTARPQGAHCDIGAVEETGTGLVLTGSPVFSDFNGDGKMDLLWRNAATGQNSVWIMDGTKTLSQTPLLTVADSSWELAATADFNGDGQTDLVWRNLSSGLNVVWYMNGATFLYQAPLPTVADRAWQLVAAADFNLDGQPDLVWHNAATGQNAVWFMSGTNLVSTGSIPTVTDTLWQMVGVADFNGDGKPDLLWRHLATGQNGIWYMDGVTKIGDAGVVALTDLRWYVGAVGDYNGDGQTDIVWRNAGTGEDVVWYLNGANLSSGVYLPTANILSWDMAGQRARPIPVKAPVDFNRDGKPDLLWRHVTTGADAVWYMNGTALGSTGNMPSSTDLNWQLIASADLNRDGQPDLIWRHKVTGQHAVWYMAGVSIAWTALLPNTADANWQISAVADFDGDGKSDFVLRNVVTGQNEIWFMNGATLVSEMPFATVADTNWRIVGAADFNGDGKPDLLWRHLTTGQNAVWYMNGATNLGSALLPTVADQTWQIGAAADFNADGKTDIAWRNYTTGQNVIWIMNGPAWVSNAFLPTVVDPNWQMLKR